MSSIPMPKLPHLPLPVIRSLPSIPGVGRPGAETTLLIGKQFGNLPDLEAILGIKHLRKLIDEHIYAYIQGKLPDVTRPPVYDARAILLANYVTEIVAKLNEVIGGFIADVTEAINSVTGKLDLMSGQRSDILALPEPARSKAERLLLSRLNQYIAEGNGQLSRLNAALSSIGT